MNYTQKSLIELMKAGKFPGETRMPKHIETVISNVFVFDTKVYKFYKNDNEFFNKSFRDLSDKAERFSFSRKDFTWNNTLSPSIYLKLVGILVRNGKIVETSSPDETEELVMVMNRINTDDVVFEKLMTGKISEQDSFTIGKQLGERLKKIQKPVTDNFYNLFESRINDLRNWIKSATEYISEEESGSYCDFLDNFRKENREWFEGQLSKEVTADGDFHSHNAVLSENTLHLMDTFPPKEAWGVGHRLTPVYRVGTDIWALSGEKKLFENFINGYENGSGIKIDRKLDDFYIVYASGIMVSYLYMLQQTDHNKKAPAKKYHTFLRNYFAKIK